MTKEAPERERTVDFMLEEYKQMGAAFFDLSRQKSQMFRFYLILVTIPISLVAAVLSISPEKSSLATLSVQFILPVLMIAIAIAGLLVTAIVVDIRFEAIIYARTINMIRKFFKELDSARGLGTYLVLPDSQEVPKFNEQPWDFKKWRWKWTLVVVLLFWRFY